jgi:hypothetical protein
MSADSPPLSAREKRALHPDFVPTFSLAAIKDRLPLRFPQPVGVLPSPKRQYRSQYRYRGHDDLADPQRLATFGPLEIALRLIDFASLRDVLAQHYAPSAKGQIPFDPVSLFLVLCLRRDRDLSWRHTAALVAGEHGATWRCLFGFTDDVTPSESGLRHFRNAVGQATFTDLCASLIDLLQQVHLIPERSTLPGDPPDRGVTLSYDGMLHPARSRMRCAHVTDTCYEPAPRPCPARATGKGGCACDTSACAAHCRLATPPDAEARLIHYTGRNKHADDRPRSRGRNVYGYLSDPLRLIDDRFACAWTLSTDVQPANTSERALFPQRLAWLDERFPDLVIGEVLADAGMGFAACLSAIWSRGALRMVDIRADPTDHNPVALRQRGYDAEGHPLCVHGFPMRPNGRDYIRRRTKWCCDKVCLRAPPDPPRGLPECPYQTAAQTHGQVVNVGRTLPDGSMRLARDVPYGSDPWLTRYGRRNLSESRNGSLEALGLKRLPCFGLTRARKEVAIGDFLVNMHTLARLVREATMLDAATPT